VGLDQEAWVSQFLRQLLDIDSDQRHIFTLALYSPSQQAAQGSKLFDSPRCFRTNQSLNLGWFIDQEASSEAGNMAISRKSSLYVRFFANKVVVCGTPHFEEAVRQGVKSNAHDISISRSGFYPDDTAASRVSQARYL
jgi:hypothetical protein